MKESKQLAAEALRSISRNEDIKAYLLHSPALYNVILKAAMRFIGGETLQECFRTAEKINQRGHGVTIDFMGESTRDREGAIEAAREFLELIKGITKAGLNASVSLDLSHIGMVIDPELAYQNASMLAAEAKSADMEIMISMEGIDRTSGILNMHERLCEEYDNVGITLQAYLHRTTADLGKALERPGKIRLVKGAYQVSKEFGLPLGPETDESYSRHMKAILSAGHPLSIATHDERIMIRAEEFMQEQGLPAKYVEFEMLHGVKPELLLKAHEAGHQTREYLPYGKEWYLYLCHRLAENPENIYQALADAVGVE